jgi:hypothetical protein
MNIRRGLWLFLGIAIVSATASFAEVKTDYDRNAGFSQYKTYCWANVHTQDPL